MKAKRNYIIYGLMLAAFAALLLWIVHLGHAYDGLGPGERRLPGRIRRSACCTTR